MTMTRREQIVAMLEAPAIQNRLISGHYYGLVRLASNKKEATKLASAYRKEDIVYARTYTDRDWHGKTRYWVAVRLRR